MASKVRDFTKQFNAIECVRGGPVAHPQDTCHSRVGHRFDTPLRVEKERMSLLCTTCKKSS
ncbi:unnamed protein product [Dovyalis caffra]|uniref:Uncharacterized protein n=1 Tax=Dovyalis caffra TaxID=77055 RepID=A0AAV1QQ55_9ROSI|nr:unnamed protein product [Dovyalis caffra]